MKYQRILLKLSGEYMGGDNPGKFGFDDKAFEQIVSQIAKISRAGVQIAIVIGGGNFFRGSRSTGITRFSGDHIGMLATVMNGLYLKDKLSSAAVDVRLMTALSMADIAETYIRDKAVRYLEKNVVLIFAAGTGNPYFTTDTAAMLRAQEISAELVIKGTMVDGIYDKDPAVYKDAQKYDAIDYDTVLNKRLGVMDSTAIAFGREHSIPICILNCHQKSSIVSFLKGNKVGSLVVNKQ